LIVVDTGGVLALLNRSDVHHAAVREFHERHGAAWVIPWAVLPEVDYLASTRLGHGVSLAFAQDVRDGMFTVDEHLGRDLGRACELLEQYASLQLGLVDAVVMAQAERWRVDMIVTTDLRHFRAVRLKLPITPRLIPADLPA
jgi:predicted nucleic acid-binding protein